MEHKHQHNHGVEGINHIGKIFWISIAVNLFYVCAEIASGIIYNSMALLTDAGHNVSDIASLLLSLLAFKLAKSKPTSRFTFGYKKTTVLAALANAVILLVATGILGYESFHRLIEPQPVQGNIIAWMAGIGILVNSISAFLFLKDREKDLNVKSAYLHLLADAMVSAGVLVGGIIINYTNWYILDPLISFVILIVIVISTWDLLSDSFKLSVDAVPAGIELEKIKKVIQKVPQVSEVQHIHIWAISTTENSLTAHVRLNDNLDFNERMDVIKEIKHRLEHENIRHSTIEMEGFSDECKTR